MAQVDATGTKDILNLFIAENKSAFIVSHKLCGSFTVCPSSPAEIRPKFEMDTARMYCHGETEVILGNILSEDASLREKCGYCATEGAP
jgi:hypothetical protein